MKERVRLLRLTGALTALSVGLVFAALALGLLPDETRATVFGRKALSEAVGVHCAREAERGDVGSMQKVLTEAVERNPDLRSAAVRRTDGKILMGVGDHDAHWPAEGAPVFDGRFASLPISLDGKPWGTLELAFEPLPTGPFGSPPETAFLGFMAGVGFLAFGLYVWQLARRARALDLVPHRVRSALETLVEGVVVLDAQGRIVLANGAFGRLANAAPDRLTGTIVDDLPWAPAAGDGLLLPTDVPWYRARKKGTAQTGVVLTLKVDKGPVRVSVNTTPILSEDGQNCGTLATFHDLTATEKTNQELEGALHKLQQSRAEIHRQNQELKLLATRDPLTLCLNRRSFMTDMNALWEHAGRSGQSFSCVMVDVDHFKKINDTFGHSIGDVVLQRVAEILRTTCRNTDLVCRYGGEEFCLLLPQVGAVAAEVQAERIRQALAAEPLGGVSVTASLGVSSSEFHAKSVQEFLDQADKALYAAKHSGRNRVMRFDALAESAKSGGPASAPVKAVEVGHRTLPYPAVMALLSALAYRDPHTAAHCRRVADLCVRIATGWLSTTECHLLEVAALLHDIGKLGVPDAILFKADPLTPEELAYVRAFDETGVEIVTAAFGSADLTRIVQQRRLWFGGAYARGAGGPVGAAIPVGARLLAVADAFDAMVTEQHYRTAMTDDEALAQLRREAGTRFDPDVVERLANVVATAAPSGATIESDMPGEAAVAIGSYIERLVHAIAARDVTGLGVVAGDLRGLTVKHRLGRFSARVTALERAVCEGSEWSELAKLAEDVLEVCRVSRRAYMDECRSARPIMPPESRRANVPTVAIMSSEPGTVANMTLPANDLYVCASDTD